MGGRSTIYVAPYWIGVSGLRVCARKIPHTAFNCKPKGIGAMLQLAAVKNIERALKKSL